ncbi:MAG: hypothetical protein HWN67_11615 [Candidatus Helarchaeota archaeon]|nr:hypothetical protein [Candidatus Helarchaeota archaeon]
MNQNKLQEILTKIVWNDNVGGISDACLISFKKDGTGECDYRELGVEESDVFAFNYEIKENKIKFFFPKQKIEYILNIKIVEQVQKNIYDEIIGTEYILIFDDHPYFLIKEMLEKKEVSIGGGKVEFYQWHW